MASFRSFSPISPSCECPLPEGALSGAAAAIAQHHGKRDLAFAEIVADALAEGRRFAGIIEGVIDELKRKAEIAAIGPEPRGLRFRPIGDHGADFGRGGEQGRGLGVDHGEIIVLGGLGVLGGDELHHLAFGDHRRGVGKDAKRAERADIDHHLEGLPEQEIADEDARLVAPQQPRRRLAAPEVALIDDVVMEQRRRMHELDARREPHMAGALIAGQLGGGDGQHRPEALAAGIDQMPRELGDQLHIGAGAVENDAVDMAHILRDKRDERRKACLWVTRTGKLNNNSQDISPQTVLPLIGL